MQLTNLVLLYLEQVNQMAEKEYKESENMRDEVEKEIRKEKEELFKES